MKRYEYRLVKFDESIAAGNLKAALNELGAEGWHLSVADAFGSAFIFARLLPEHSCEPACNHASDCAVHNEPVYRAEACDCGAEQFPQPRIKPLRWYGPNHPDNDPGADDLAVAGGSRIGELPVTAQEEEAMREKSKPSLASIQYDLCSLDEAQLRAVIESCRVQLAVRGVKEAAKA